MVGVVRVDYLAGGREAVLALQGLPAEPARATLRHLQDNPLALIRQLEYRVGDLDNLHRRVQQAQHDAAAEAQRARDALDRPFKYQSDLSLAQARVKEIDDQMTQRQARSTPAGGVAEQPGQRVARHGAGLRRQEVAGPGPVASQR